MNITIAGIETKLAPAILVTLLLLCISAVSQTPQASEKLAQQSSESWLALVDTGKYAESWDEAAQLFKAAVTKDQWQGTLHASRDPLGKLVSRTVKSASYTKMLPGAPDGEYVVIQYDTNFEHKQAAVETVVPMLDKDGNWRISGYFIK